MTDDGTSIYCQACEGLDERGQVPQWNGPTLIEFVPNCTRQDINRIEADGLHLDHLFETMEELGLVSNAMEASNVVVQNTELERPIYLLIDIMR